MSHHQTTRRQVQHRQANGWRLVQVRLVLSLIEFLDRRKRRPPGLLEPGCDFLCAAERTQKVATRELDQLSIGPTATNELCEEIWVSGRVFQADRHIGLRAVEVAAETHVVDAGHLADVLT